MSTGYENSLSITVGTFYRVIWKIDGNQIIGITQDLLSWQWGPDSFTYLVCRQLINKGCSELKYKVNVICPESKIGHTVTNGVGTERSRHRTGTRLSQRVRYRRATKSCGRRCRRFESMKRPFVEAPGLRREGLTTCKLLRVRDGRTVGTIVRWDVVTTGWRVAKLVVKRIMVWERDGW